jgi:hypothetical protein
MGLAEFTLGIITNLLSSVIYDRIKDVEYFQHRKIKRRVEDATAEVVEALIPFLENEHISKDKQHRLIKTCISELRPLTQKPERLFQGSLNGQKIFDELYSSRALPQVVIEDGLKDIYTLLCPRIAELLCKIPAAVKDWESEAWAENFQRFDEITSDLRTLFNKVDEADAILTRVRQAVAQKIAFELDLTGLRGDRPSEGKFDDFFVCPSILEITYEQENARVARNLENADQSFDIFSAAKINQLSLVSLGQVNPRGQYDFLCIRVELRSLADKDLPSLHELIRSFVGPHLAEELTADRIRSWILSRKIIFILDGFDEIRPIDRDEIYDWFTGLNTAVQDCPIVVTSRPLTTDHLNRLNSTWTFWEIQPFNQERIFDYIQKWYKSTPLLAEEGRRVNTSELAGTWSQDPTIEPLTGNPLLLSTLLMVHHLDGSLPRGRSELYRRYVAGMLGLWDDRRNVTATSLQLSLEQKRQIMRRFALKMFLQQKDQLDEHEALEIMKAVLGKLNISLSEEDVLSGLRERSGLIIGPGIYSFVHKSVLEYLVAESVLQGDERDDSDHRIDRLCLFKNRDDDRWNTIIFLWAGLAPFVDVESFVEECIKIQMWDLAYGILYDQYDKFPLEIRRIFLLKIVKFDQTLINYKHHYYWVCSYAHSKATLRIHTFDLRNISSSFSDFHNLIDQAVRDKTLIWADATNATGGIKDLLWMICACAIEDSDEWKNCLNSCDESDFADMVMRRHFVITTITSKFLRSKPTNLDVKKFKKLYTDIQPEFGKLMPISLMSVVGDFTIVSAKINRFDFHPDNPFSLDAILEVIDSCNVDDVPEELLVETNNWHSWLHDENYDLLANFLNVLKKLELQSLVENSPHYINAVVFVDKLLIRRDTLR